MNNRYNKLFKTLNRKQQGAFVPFVTLHDPNFERSLDVIQCLIDHGADALELGLPFSDPIADGPIIQKASIRALQSGSTVDRCFNILKKIRSKNPDIPIGLLIYSNLVIANGIDDFYSLAANMQVDSILIADVPMLESKPFVEAATAVDVQSIFIAPPNANEEVLEQVAKLGKGYTYLLSRAGVTGIEAEAEMPVTNIVATLKKYLAPPCLLGFGISTPEHVSQAIKLDIAGVISGSAVVKKIEENLQDHQQLLNELGQFVASMKKATYR